MKGIFALGRSWTPSDVRVCWFSVERGREGAISISLDQNIKERDFVVDFFFVCKFHPRVNAAKTLFEV